MSLWVVTVIAVATGIVACVLLCARIRADRTSSISKLLERELLSITTHPMSEGSLKTTAEVLKVLDSMRPWQERALSTIGVVAFFGMTTGAVVQTINASVQTAKAERLVDERVRFEEEKREVEAIVGEVTSAVLDDPLRVGGHWDNVLRYRASSLKERVDPTDGDLSERFQILVLLGLYGDAAALIDERGAKLQVGTPDNLVLLAEYRYLTGSASAAKGYASEIQTSVDRLTRGARLRWAALRHEFGWPRAELVEEVRRILKGSDAEANAYLETRVQQLRRGIAANRAADKGKP